MRHSNHGQHEGNSRPFEKDRHLIRCSGEQKVAFMEKFLIFIGHMPKLLNNAHFLLWAKAEGLLDDEEVEFETKNDADNDDTSESKVQAKDGNDS